MVSSLRADAPSFVPLNHVEQHHEIEVPPTISTELSSGSGGTTERTRTAVKSERQRITRKQRQQPHPHLPPHTHRRHRSNKRDQSCTITETSRDKAKEFDSSLARKVRENQHRSKNHTTRDHPDHYDKEATTAPVVVARNPKFVSRQGAVLSRQTVREVVHEPPAEELWKPNDPALFPTLSSTGSKTSSLSSSSSSSAVLPVAVAVTVTSSNVPSSSSSQDSLSSSPSSGWVWSQHFDKLRNGLLLETAANNNNNGDEHLPHTFDDLATRRNSNILGQASGTGLTILNNRKKRSTTGTSLPVVTTNATKGESEVSSRAPLASEENPPVSCISHPKTDKGPVVVCQDNNQCNSDGTKNINSNTQLQRRRLDIDRLRDRWWDTLHKHHQQMKIKETSQFNTNEETSGKSSSSVSSSSSSSEVNSLVHFETSTSFLQQTSLFAANYITAPLEPLYDRVSSPVHEAIRRDDEIALRELLRRKRESKLLEPNCDDGDDDNDTLIVSPIQLAVQLDRPRLVRILLKENRNGNNNLSREMSSSSLRLELPPLLLAAELGHDECLRLIIGESYTSSSLLVRDLDDNNVLHVCCFSNLATASTLQTILSCTTSNSILLSKLLQSKNKCGQTPLHVACQRGRSTIVEAILASNLSFALLSKLLIQQDNAEQTPLLAAISSGSTDVVMSLLMWRGNNHTNGTPVTSSTAASTAFPCPLAWAVLLGNLDMALLLLEFNDPSGHGYDLVKALRVAVTNNCSDDKNNIRLIEDHLEIIRVLVNAGANPCAIAIDDGGGLPQACTLNIAAKHGDAESMVALLDSYENYLQRVRSERRRDPVLRKQPESFFSGIESQENALRYSALRDALVTCLFSGYESGDFTSPYYTCCDILCRRGAQLGSVGLLRLKSCLAASALLSVDTQSPHARNLVCNYQVQCPIVMANELPLPNYWSLVMLQMPWMEIDSDIDCWRLVENSGADTTGVHIPDTDVVLVCEDGTRFGAHSTILALKSEKLAAAMRFASMASCSSSQCFEIAVDSSPKMVIWMLHHIYHGSLVFGESNLSDPSSLAHELLELLLLAEEFLCPTLVQECEMRLLSSEPHRCFCSSCVVAHSADTCVVRVHGPSKFLELSDPIALDILAVAQQISHNGCVHGCYNIELSWSESPAKLHSTWPKNGITVQPLVSLRDAAVSSLLLNWSLAMDNPDFQSQFHEETAGSGSGLVLHSCLDELAHSPITSKSKGNQWTHAHDSKKVVVAGKSVL